MCKHINWEQEDKDCKVGHVGHWAVMRCTNNTAAQQENIKNTIKVINQISQNRSNSFYRFMETSLLRQPNNEGYYPVHLAINCDHFEKKLNNSDADADMIIKELSTINKLDANQRTRSGDTPLHLAARRGLSNTYDRLEINRANPRLTNDQGQKPDLNNLNRNRNSETQILIKFGVDITSYNLAHC